MNVEKHNITMFGYRGMVPELAAMARERSRKVMEP